MFDNLRGDATAAINIVIISVPSVIGIGMVATHALGPAYSAIGALAGLLGLIAATLVPPFSGASRFQFNTPGPGAAGILGTLGATILAMPELVARHSPQAMAELALNAIFLCSLLVGFMHILIGQMRLGNLIKLVPQTVITGVMNGILILIVLSQLPWFMGLPEDVALSDFAAVAQGINFQDLTVGGIAIIAVLSGARLLPRVPPYLTGMAAGTAVYWAMQSTEIYDLGATIGRIPEGIPTPHRLIDMAALTGNTDVLLLAPHILFSAIAITFITGIGALVTASSADALSNTRHRPVGELTGLGVGNVAAAVFSGLPSGGSPTNVVLNYQSGGRTRKSHVITAILLVACLLGLAPVIAIIPLSVVSGVLIVMSFKTFDIWPVSLARKMITLRDRGLRRNVAFNFALISMTMVLIVFTNLMTAVVAGLVLSLLHYLLDSGDSLIRQTLSGSALHSNVVRDQRTLSMLQEQGDSMRIIILQGSLFFGNTDYLARFLDEVPSTVTVVLLDLKRISNIDSSGVLLLSRLDRRFAQDGKTILFTGLPPQSGILELLQEYGLKAPVESGRIFSDLNSGLAHGENLVLRSLGQHSQTQQEIPLAETVPYKSLNEAEMYSLNLERREYGADETIISQGDEADGLYVLVSGRVCIQRQDTRRNRTVVLVEFGPGVNLGEMAILGGSRRTADVVAREPSVLYFLAKETFDQMRTENPVLAVKILTNISGSLSRRLMEASRSIVELETF